MRPAVVQLIDLGLDQSFDQSMALTQSLIQSINVDWKHPAAEVEFIRIRDLETVAAALAAGSEIAHIMSHSSKKKHEESAALVSDDGQTVLDLDQLARNLQDRQAPLASAVLFADCCDSFGKAFQRAIRDMLSQPVLYLGAKGMIGWHDATTFGSAFYSAYFRRKGKGLDPLARAEDAAYRAVASYEQLLNRTCPYGFAALQASRKAKGVFH